MQQGRGGDDWELFTNSACETSHEYDSLKIIYDPYQGVNII